MKAIMISIKPKWVAKILNGEKTIEVRKNKALANAIQKLINENGYADIYVYCSKEKILGNIIKVGSQENSDLFGKNAIIGINKGFMKKGDIDLQGKVVFKFRCYKVEEIEDVYSQENEFGGLYESFGTKTLKTNSLLSKSRLDYIELANYLNDYTPFGYAIHISDLEIFDKPKELNEFCNIVSSKLPLTRDIKYLTKAPQNFTYLEV